MLEWLTVPIIACALTHGDTNLPRDNRDELARIEAQAFLDADAPGSSFMDVLAIAYTETRFNPTGSDGDRRRGYWGVMQIECSRCGNHLQQTLLDPRKNILFGAGLLRRRGSVGAFYWGSRPTSARGRRRVRHYERLVHRARGIMYARLTECRDVFSNGL